MALIVLLPTAASAEGVEGGEWVLEPETPEIVDVPPGPGITEGLNPWQFEESELLSEYVDVSALTGIATDLTKLVPVDALLNGDLLSLLPDTKILDDTVSGLLSSLPNLNGALDGVRDYLAALDLPDVALGVGEVSVPIVDFMRVIKDIPSLPTTYTLRLTRPGFTDRVYSGPTTTICAPVNALWPGTTSLSGYNEIVEFCPTGAPAATLTGTYTGTGNPPLGAGMSIEYLLPEIPNLIPPNTKLRMSGTANTSQAFPATFELEGQVQQGTGQYSSGRQFNLGIVSNTSALLPPNTQPLKSAQIKLDGYGSATLNAFAGGQGTFTIQYAQDGSFKANWSQTQDPGTSSTQSIALSATSGSTPVADATFGKVPRTFEYKVDILTQALANGSTKTNGVQVNGGLMAPNMTADLTAYSSGRKKARMYQSGMPVAFNKLLQVTFDPQGTYPLKIHSEQINTPAAGSTSLPVGDLIEIAGFNDNATNAVRTSIQVGGAAENSTFDLVLRYDANFGVTGFTATGSNAPDTNRFFFQAAEWTSNSKVFTVSQPNSSSVPEGNYRHTGGTHTDFTMQKTLGDFSFAVDATTTSPSQVRLQIHATMGDESGWANSAGAKLQTKDSSGNPLGFLIAQFPPELDVFVDVASVNGSPTGVKVEETDSVSLTSHVRQFWKGTASTPNQVLLSVQGESADPVGAGGYNSGTKLSLKRKGPPAHFTFEVTAPAGACSAPSDIKIVTNSFNGAVPQGSTDQLSVSLDGVGGIVDHDLPEGSATRTVTLLFDGNCAPAGLKLTGASGTIDQPNESVRLYTTFGQVLVAKLPRSFTTEVTYQLAGGANDVRLHQTNGVPLSQQFVQFGKTSSPSFVFTVENGYNPTDRGSLPYTANASVRAHAMDPTEFTLSLSASNAGGTSLTLSGTNGSVQDAAYVDVSASAGSMKVAGLGLDYQAHVNVASAGGVTVDGHSTNYAKQAVTLTALFQGQKGSLVIAGPNALATSPAADADIKAHWDNAPPAGYKIDIGLDGTTGNLNVALTGAESRSDSVFRADVESGAIPGCSTGCHFVMGGGIVAGTRSASVGVNAAAGSLHVAGATTAPSGQFNQAWVTNANGSIKALISVLGPAAVPTLPITTAATEYRLKLTNMSTGYTFDIGSRKDPGAQTVTLNAQSARDTACGTCIVKLEAFGATAPITLIQFEDLPLTFQLDGTQNGPGLSFSYSGSAYGLDMEIGQSLLTYDFDNLPTKVSGTTAGSFGEFSFTLKLSTAGSTCADQLVQCTIGSVVVKKRNEELSLPAATYPIEEAQSWGTIVGAVTMKLSYRFSYQFTISRVSLLEFKMARAPQTGIPILILKREGTTPTDSLTSAVLEFVGPGGTGSPRLCISPTCNAATPDSVHWTLTANPVGYDPRTITDNGANAISINNSTGSIYFWGWDVHTADTNKYQLNTNTAINQNNAGGYYASVPFAPTYTAMSNKMGGSGSKYQVYVLNPENWILRTNANTCPSFRFFPVRSNCLWQVALNQIPTDPVGA